MVFSPLTPPRRSLLLLLFPTLPLPQKKETQLYIMSYELGVFFSSTPEQVPFKNAYKFDPTAHNSFRDSVALVTC